MPEKLKNLRSFLQLVTEKSEKKGYELLPSVADIRREAKKNLPRMIFDFVDGGSGEEISLRANTDDFSKITFNPRSLVDTSTFDSTISLGDEKYPGPVFFGPAGLAKLVGNNGELSAVRAAGHYGVPYIISTSSAVELEELARASSGPLWFQIYLWRSKALVHDLVTRALNCGCEALVLTIDVPVGANRIRDLRNGMSIPPRMTLKNIAGGARHPKWLFQTAFGEPVGFQNFKGHAEGNSALSHSEFINQELSNPGASWSDLNELRDMWPHKLYVKGIMTVDDALKAQASGVDGVVISNHGGRQLDGLQSSISALPSIRAAVGPDFEVLIDGGLRTGVDVLKAMASGADATMIARPWVFGVAMGGQQGAERILSIFNQEIKQTSILLGIPRLDALDTSYVNLPSDWL